MVEALSPDCKMLRPACLMLHELDPSWLAREGLLLRCAIANSLLCLAIPLLML